MKIRFVILAAIMVSGIGAQASQALNQSTFTQVINDVKVKSTSEVRPGLVSGVVKSPEIVQTGSNSRAELKAPDETLTRVGANTVFSFDTAGRGIDLKQGTVLFHSPEGKGGGTIRTAAATAAVTGTTIMVVATSNGGFKLVVLEGRARARIPGGRGHDLKAGQLTFIIPGQKQIGPVLNFDLKQAIERSNMVKGFSQPVASQGKIDAEVEKQQKAFKSGRAEVTDTAILDAVGLDGVQIANRNAIETIFRQEDLDASTLVANAFATDLLINTATIPADRIFEGSGVFVRNLFPELGEPDGPNGPGPGPNHGPTFDVAQASRVFFVPASNITFDTPDLDLSPFAGAQGAAFIAQNNILFNQGFTSSGFQGFLGFFALNGELAFLPGIYDFSSPSTPDGPINASFHSALDIVLDNASIRNNSKGLDFTSDGKIIGKNADFISHFLSLDSLDTIQLDNASGMQAVRFADLIADNLIHIDGRSLGGATNRVWAVDPGSVVNPSVRMEAGTIVIKNTTFGTATDPNPHIHFFTDSGNWQTSPAVVNGHLNLIGVEYHNGFGFVPVTGSGGPGPVAGNIKSFQR